MITEIKDPGQFVNEKVLAWCIIKKNTKIFY